MRIFLLFGSIYDQIDVFEDLRNTLNTPARDIMILTAPNRRRTNPKHPGRPNCQNLRCTRWGKDHGDQTMFEKREGIVCTFGETAVVDACIEHAESVR